MERQDRKAAIAEYRERKVDPGVYALRCTASGEAWVGRAPDLATIWNRLSFTLRQGTTPQRALQEAWNAHGADAFAFEVLEVLDAEELGLGLGRELKKRHADWVERLGAMAI
ncbi:hypothetical protein EDF56_104518 [Novosphingobium sp. PhB165]|uniref:GIY-YIG nuclease family protein n=1 Tax=Novosphingobium sp. PhB165 TaxID=2485105 RepID=UPI0010481758|nr:GIY-YIG nuclease family protein [Novosphingobium sp. PhB165]TCM18983.1 hypothetical protein EDF56_104518 [Novosphingobium sp. PhB165]